MKRALSLLLMATLAPALGLASPPAVPAPAPSKQALPVVIQEKKVNFIIQTEPKAAGLAGAPSVQDLARTEDDRRIMQLIVAGDAIGKPIATAPNVPAERVQALREAFLKTLQDPEFIKAATAARTDINPVPGVQIQEMVQKVLATPKNLAARAKAIRVEPW